MHILTNNYKDIIKIINRTHSQWEKRPTTLAFKQATINALF